MSKIVAEHLRELVAKHGQDLCDDRCRLKGLLADKCGGKFKKEIFALMTALNEGIVAEILRLMPLTH